MMHFIMKWLGWFVIIVGFISALIQGLSVDWITAFIWFFASFVSGALFLAISEALQYLEIIAYNTDYLRNDHAQKVSDMQKRTYPSTGKSINKPSLESLSQTHTFKSLD